MDQYSNQSVRSIGQVYLRMCMCTCLSIHRVSQPHPLSPDVRYFERQQKFSVPPLPLFLPPSSNMTRGGFYSGEGEPRKKLPSLPLLRSFQPSSFGVFFFKIIGNRFNCRLLPRMDRRRRRLLDPPPPVPSTVGFRGPTDKGIFPKVQNVITTMEGKMFLIVLLGGGI